ncbi:MAG: PilX N-terminal domain-containing pilus assembly protein [Candidatus Electrothrix sp. YB6]
MKPERLEQTIIREEPEHTAPDASGSGFIENEEGFVLALSMMVLVVLTLLGISANRTSVTELQIARNDNIAKMLFYKAEAAVNESGQRLENEKDPEKLKAKRPMAPKWLSEPDIMEKLMERDEDVWKGRESEIWKGRESEIIDDVEMAALDYGVVKGDEASSLGMGKAGNLYFFKLIGKADYDDPMTGRTISKMIETGYRKRY